MILLEEVTKVVINGGKSRKVLSGVTAAIPTNRRIALLSTSDEDAKVLIDILAGKTLPTSGNMTRRARVSYPVGDVSGFDLDMTVRSNVAYVAQLYGVDVKSTVSFVERSTRLGRAFDKPFRDLPRGARTTLGQIVTYSIPFDLYLLNRDSTGQNNIQSAATAVLDARLAQSAGLIAAVNVPPFARQRCDMGLVLHNGHLTAVPDLDQAFSMARQLRRERRPR